MVKLKENEIKKILTEFKYHLERHRTGHGEIIVKLVDGQMLYIRSIEDNKIK